MNGDDYMQEAIFDIALETFSAALPWALTFGFMGYLIKTFLNMAFGRRWKL